MEQTFKLHIDAMSPDGKSVNCQSQINVQCTHGMSVTLIANILKQEPKLKLIFAEAVVLAIDDVEITEPISSDDFLDSILRAKNKEKEV